jgi:hypothetical protein
MDEIERKLQDPIEFALWMVHSGSDMDMHEEAAVLAEEVERLRQVATTPTLEKLMRETVEQRRRIRELEAERDEARRQLNVATALGSLLGKELNQATDRIAELKALLAASGPEISHDDVARILAQAPEGER